MDKFCVFCGKPLEEGQECDCQKNVGPEETAAEEPVLAGEAVQQEQPEEAPVQVNSQTAYDGRLPEEPVQECAAPQSAAVQIRPQSYMIPKKESGAFANFLKRCWVILTRFFAHPVQIIRIAAEKKDFTAGLVFWVMNAVIAGLLPAVAVPRLLRQLLGPSVMQLIDFPGGWIWVEGFLMSMLWTTTLSALAFAFAKAMRSRASFKSVMGAVGVSCIGMAAIQVIASLFILLSPGFGLCFYLFTQGVTLVLLYIALAQSLGVGQDKAVYCLLIALAVVGLFMALFISGTVSEVLDELMGSALGGFRDYGSGGGLLR